MNDRLPLERTPNFGICNIMTSSELVTDRPNQLHDLILGAVLRMPLCSFPELPTFYIRVCSFCDRT
jgi:hypothetical protein